MSIFSHWQPDCLFLLAAIVAWLGWKDRKTDYSKCSKCGADDWECVGTDGGLQLGCMPLYECRVCSKSDAGVKAIGSTNDGGTEHG